MRNSPLAVLGIALVVVVVGLVKKAVKLALVGAVAFIGILSVLVFLHELGHYAVARRVGMRPTEFFIGFGPRLWSFRRGETEYGVKAIPLGGYVRISGMNPHEELPPEVQAGLDRQLAARDGHDVVDELGGYQFVDLPPGGYFLHWDEDGELIWRREPTRRCGRRDDPGAHVPTHRRA